MTNAPLPLFINGAWVTTDKSQPVINPFTQEAVGHVCLGRESEMDAAIAAAHAARRPLAAMTNAARGDALEAIRAGLAARQEDLARTLCLESGKPIKDARIEVQRAVHVFQIAAEEARRFGSGEVIPLDRLASSAHRTGLTRRFPAGVVGAITPFNFPLNLVAHKVAPALAAGCPVVLKPAHQTPMTALALGRIIAETDLPPGAFNVVHAPPNLGERLATDPRIAVLSFTGSAKVGWRLKALANTKRVTLELGGNAAVVVHADADLAFAVARCVIGAFSYSGQVCISVQRIFVHAAIYEKFLEEFVAGAKSLQAGDPLDEKTDIGPLISEDAAKRIEAWVQEAVTGGTRLQLGTGRAEGRFVAPTALSDTTSDMAVNREEVFGPVVTVTPYRDFDEALDCVNDSAYGLQAGIFTQDVGRLFRAFETLEIGGVIGNDVPTYRMDQMPYGGVKGSGFGREGVRYAMEEMSELRLLALNLA
ncbi:MAG: aldehyde dehydrogenase family protein [Armatimonadota bacterium]|nr:aldehyde dehydrogenase family protein [Armatimonadota bacterium]